MKIIISFLLPVVVCSSLCGQQVEAVIAKVKQAQQSLKTVSYTLQRTDTLVTGETRVVNGTTKIQVAPADTIFGFHFWSKRDDINHESIYDGSAALIINHDTKEYRTEVRPFMFPHFLGSPGGQVVLTELIRIDTSNATGFNLQEDNQYYYLTIYLPDITKYDLIKRSKLLTIDKKMLLPVGMRSRLEKLGKVEDLNYRIKNIRINDQSDAYDFSGIRFPGEYKPQKAGVNKVLQELKEKAPPAFALLSFDGKTISSSSFAGKTVLLDFWEVWCGPCVASMPKVQDLYKKYKDKGLLVYGIINETEHLEASKMLVQKKQIAFPMLAGNKQLAKDYGVQAVPLYILINKEGKVSYTSEGFTEQLEQEIQKSLQ